MLKEEDQQSPAESGEESSEYEEESGTATSSSRTYSLLTFLLINSIFNFHNK